MGLLEEDKVKIAKRPIPIKFDTLYSEQEQEYREFRYTPDLKRPISIIDPETTEADQIIVIDKGRIVQRGNHKELIGQDGVYQ